MLKNKTKIIAFLLIIFLLFSTTSVFADNETNNNEQMPISDNESQTINDNKSSEEDSYKKSDVYICNDNVIIDYIVDGNLFVCAETVTINSQIGGDAFIFAKNVIIDEKGYVFNNLFTTAESVEIKGVVFDVFAATKNLTITNGYIYRDLKVACDNFTMNGVIGRNAFIDCSTMNFSSDENSSHIIYGDLNYTSNSEISIPENIVSGNINYTPSKLSSEKSLGSIISDCILELGEFLVFVIIIWLLYLVLSPKFLSNTNKYVGKATLKVFGLGLLSLIAIPVICFILILLNLTAGFSLFLLALYVLAIVVSKSLFTITANNYLCSKLKINKSAGIFGMLIISGIIIKAITYIPYIGTLISFIITILGLGILVSSILPKKSEDKEIIVNSENNKKSDQ